MKIVNSSPKKFNKKIEKALKNAFGYRLVNSKTVYQVMCDILKTKSYSPNRLNLNHAFIKYEEKKVFVVAENFSMEGSIDCSSIKFYKANTEKKALRIMWDAVINNLFFVFAYIEIDELISKIKVEEEILQKICRKIDIEKDNLISIRQQKKLEFCEEYYKEIFSDDEKVEVLFKILEESEQVKGEWNSTEVETETGKTFSDSW